MNSKKVTLGLRIFLIVLSALMVLSIAYTTIVMAVNAVHEKREANKEQTETVDEHAGHNHD